MKQLTIGSLGRHVSLSPKTIRFYEEIGLITKAQRAENGYRVYSEKAVEELSLIKNARDMGLPIPEIKKLMKGCTDGKCEHTQLYIKNSVAEYLDTLDKKIHQLQILKNQLIRLKDNMHFDLAECKDGKTYCCNILNQLNVKGGDA